MLLWEVADVSGMGMATGIAAVFAAAAVPGSCKMAPAQRSGS